MSWCIPNFAGLAFLPSFDSLTISVLVVLVSKFSTVSTSNVTAVTSPIVVSFAGNLHEILK